MAEQPDELERTLLVRVLRMNARAMGLVFGLLAGLGLFVATNLLVLKGGPRVGPTLALVGQFFPGYTVTFVGSLIGFAYAFAVGFVVGYGVAFVYNWAARKEGGEKPKGGPPS